MVKDPNVPPTTPAPLSAYTGYLLRRAYARAAECANACLGPEHHIREVALLSILDERGSLSQSELADLTHVNRTIMVKLVDNLEQQGWVTRGRNTRDRRSYALEVTERGREVLLEINDELDHAEALLTDALTAAERERLFTYLGALIDDDELSSIESLAHRSGYLITQAHRHMRARAVEELRPLGVEPRDFGVLSTLQREQPCSQQHMAAQLGVSPPAILMFVDGLEGAGLVSRSRNSADRRAYDLTLTDAGSACLAKADEAARRVQSEVVEKLGVRGDRDLRELLTKIVNAGPSRSDSGREGPAS
jgi:DNA-binding MarR family transcriptional regulator